MATGIIFSFSCRTDKCSIPLVKTPGQTAALSIFAPIHAHHQDGMITDWSHPPRTVRRLTPRKGQWWTTGHSRCCCSAGGGAVRRDTRLMHGSVYVYVSVSVSVCHCLHTRFNFKRHQVCCKPSSLSFAAESSCAMLSVTVSCYSWSGHDASLCIIVYITPDFF